MSCVSSVLLTSEFTSRALTSEFAERPQFENLQMRSAAALVLGEHFSCQVCVEDHHHGLVERIVTHHLDGGDGDERVRLVSTPVPVPVPVPVYFVKQRI